MHRGAVPIAALGVSAGRTDLQQLDARLSRAEAAAVDLTEQQVSTLKSQLSTLP
jgi:hypothetical protein